jgi:hypothetical protein
MGFMRAMLVGARSHDNAWSVNEPSEALNGEGDHDVRLRDEEIQSPPAPNAPAERPAGRARLPFRFAQSPKHGAPVVGFLASADPLKQARTVADALADATKGRVSRHEPFVRLTSPPCLSATDCVNQKHHQHIVIRNISTAGSDASRKRCERGGLGGRE